MKVLLKSKIKMLAGTLNDYLLAWIENQSRTPNDKYLTNHNKENEWTHRNKHIKTKFYGFFQQLRTKK